MPERGDRLTPRVQRVLRLAQDEAERLRHAEVRSEHVLLGLLREGRGLGARALRELGVTAEDIRQRIMRQLQLGDLPLDAPPAHGPEVVNALAMAESEAERFHHSYLGTEHVLLGLLREGEGLGYLTLVAMGVSLDRTRRQVIKMLNETPPQPRSGPSPEALEIARSRQSTPRGRGPTVDAPESCRRCNRPRRPDWRFCAFCGEPWPRCDRCHEPLPLLAGVQFCPHCGGTVE